MRLVISLGLTVALVAGLGVACGGGGSSTPPDLTKTYDTISFYPGSSVDGGPVAPAGIIRYQVKDFVNDRRMAVLSPNITREQVLDYFSQDLPKRGWTKEDPPKPRTQVMKDYCKNPIYTCLSFTKDDIRLIVSAPIQLGLNPEQTQGISYHIHLEKK